ncbi:MmcQ/YjbR family DNA-binding protein [Chitinophaga lutea]
MVTIARIRELCLSMPEVTEVSHVGLPAFRTKRRIFATVWEGENKVNFCFEPGEQAAFVKAAPKIFVPVAGGWGRMGWTSAFLAHGKEDILYDAVKSAWYNAAPPKLQAAYRASFRE